MGFIILFIALLNKWEKSLLFIVNDLNRKSIFAQFLQQYLGIKNPKLSAPNADLG